jgi:hypothetical protein
MMDCSQGLSHYNSYLWIFPSRKIEIISVNNDLQSIKEVIKEGSRSKGKRITNKLEKAYLALLFMPIFPSQLEDLGEGMEAKKILVPAHPRASKIGT